MIHAPWTDDQVEALNRFQRAGAMHPFTCSATSTVLVATPNGWVCPCGCGWTQDWAHEFMLDPRTHRAPLEGLRPDLGNPYEGADPRLAWMLRVLSDEFGMLGVLKTQQAAFDYVNSGGTVDNRLGPDSDEPPEPTLTEEANQTLARLGTDAVKWAEEFKQSRIRNTVVVTDQDGPTAGQVMDLLHNVLDTGTLIAWFASAIGAGESKHAVELDYLAYLAGRHYPEKARDWFESYYGSDAYKAPGPGGLIADWAEKLSKTRKALVEVKKNFASAPDGWFTFGTHAAVDDVRLEFWGADEAGMPVYERPVTEDETEPEALTGVVRPRDESDDEHYFNATGRMRERAERAEARLSEMRTVRDALQERIKALESELGSAYKSRPICYEPIAPMSIGSTCEKCGHHSMAHTDNGPCLVCVLEGKYGARIASA